MDFVATSNAKTITPHVTARWYFLPYSIDLDEDDKIGCDSITTLDGAPACPLIKGKTYKYKVNVHVKRLPLSSLNIGVDIYLEGGEGRQTCFNFDAAL